MNLKANISLSQPILRLQRFYNFGTYAENCMQDEELRAFNFILKNMGNFKLYMLIIF